MRIGVLALQGDFAAHAAALGRLGVVPTEVRRCREIESLDGLVLPGGESTTLLNLMRDEPWFDALRGFHARGGALLGTCAGAILLARQVEPVQPSLALLDVVIARNAYGRQVDSFEAAVALAGERRSLPAIFIRAPRFRELGRDVDVLACHGQEPVAVRQGRILAATFHPELTDDTRFHKRFLDLAASAASAGEGPGRSRPLPATSDLAARQEGVLSCGSTSTAS